MSSVLGVRSIHADDPEFREVLEQFVASVPARGRQLADAHREQQFDALRRLAHQLKGSGGGYGFAELSARAAALEMACRAGDAARIQSTLNSLLVHMNCITL